MLNFREWGVLVHKNSLVPCQLVSSQHRATRSDVSFHMKKSEYFVTVDLTPHTCIHLRETLCFSKVACSPPSWSLSFLHHVNRSVWLWSLNIRIIFTINNFVDTIWHWNQRHHRHDFWFKKCASGKIFYEIQCAASKASQTKCAAGHIFWLNPDG